MFPHSILEKFAVKLNALERQANILYQKTSSTGKKNEQFICPDKQREMISNCQINKNEMVQQKSLRKANPMNRKLQINEQSSLQEGQILDPPKSNSNLRSQQIKNRVRKTWTKPNVQSFQKAAIVELETKQEKETKRIKEIEIKEIKQQKRKNTPDRIKDRIRKTWEKPDGKLEQDEKETKQIKETYKQKIKAQSHKSTIHINSEDSNRHHQIIQETQELKVKSKGKVCLNENNLPYVYMMDNLVSMYLCNRVPGQLIKIYIKQLSCSYEIPYNKILIFFGIEALIARFCTNHDISSQFLDNYLCSELEMMLPHFINRVRISNWYVIQRVALGVVKRLGIKKEITDHWLLTVLNKSKKFLREGKVDVQKIFRVAKSREISSLNLCEEPTQNQMNQVNYKGENMKQFLRTNQQILSLIQFRDTDEQQVIQTSEREGVSNKLTYFKKLKLKAQLNQKQKQKQKQEGGKKNKKNKKKFEAQILSNCPEAYQVSSCQIQLNQEPQSDISFISQQSYQKQNSDESFVKVSDEDKQTTRGKKQKKLKQKKMDKQKQKHTYNLRRGIGIQEESRFIQKYKPTKEQKQRQKTKQKQKMLQKIEMKQINKKTESKRTNVNRDEQIKDVIQWLEQNQISESPFKAENNMLENIEKIKKSQKIKKLEIEEQGLVKMDKILFQFFQQKPELTIKMIKQQISRILKEEMNIPLKFHSKISDKWLERFRGARIR